MVPLDLKDKTKFCGIYCIKNKITNKVYIGKSYSIRKRVMEHLSELLGQKHPNKHLQSSYNKYGINNFELYIAEKCDVNISPIELKNREQNWVDNYGKINLYNKILDVINHDGNAFLNKNHSDETKLKMSLAKKGKQLGKNNPNFGKKQDLVTRIKMVINSSNTKLSVNDVLEIKKFLEQGNLLDGEIANMFNVSRTVVTRISNGTRWANITGPIIKKERRGKRNIGKKHTPRIKN